MPDLSEWRTALLPLLRSGEGGARRTALKCALLVGWALAYPATTPLEAQQETVTPIAMARYSVVVLRTGNDLATADSATIAAVRSGHMQNIRDMEATGKLLTAGPVGGAEGVQGLFIFIPGTSAEEIDALLQKDPAISGGWLNPEVWVWYSPAGLQVPKPSGGSPGGRMP